MGATAGTPARWELARENNAQVDQTPNLLGFESKSVPKSITTVR